MKKEINLVPKDMQKDVELTGDHLLVLLMILSIIIVMIIGSRQNIQYTKIKKERLTLERKKSNLELEISGITAVEAQMAEREKSEAFIKEVLKQRKNWADYFKELSLLLPSDVWLSEFKVYMEKGKLEMQIKGQSNSQMSIASFYQTLSHSQRYNRLIINYSELLNGFSPPLFRFVLGTQGFVAKNSDRNASTTAAINPLKGLL